MKCYVLSYVGLSYDGDANGYNEVSVHSTLENAREHLNIMLNAEIENCKEMGEQYTIQVEKNECTISWAEGEMAILRIFECNV